MASFQGVMVSPQGLVVGPQGAITISLQGAEAGLQRLNLLNQS
jgi:hypothetical protein